jgi:hypothetical protein
MSFPHSSRHFYPFRLNLFVKSAVINVIMGLRETRTHVDVTGSQKNHKKSLQFLSKHGVRGIHSVANTAETVIYTTVSTKLRGCRSKAGY